MNSKPRLRSKGSFVTITGTLLNVDASCTSGSVFTPNYMPDCACNGEILTTQDYVTPNYFRRSRAGEIIINPFWSEREIQTASGTYCAGISVGNSCNSPVKKNVFDCGGPQAWARIPGNGGYRLPRTLLISNDEISSAISVAATSTWNKSNDHSADVLVDIAEISKTLQMLKNPIKSTSSLISKIKAGKSGVKALKVKDVSDYAVDMWLQYRFGIRPLVSSVQGVVKALDALHTKRRQTYRSSYPDLRKTAVSTYTLTSGNPFNFTSQFNHTDELSVRTGLILETEVALSKAVGVDASGILGLPWELVPFSFVADWFANVNDYLGALVPYLTKSPLGSWVSVKRRTSTVFTVTGSSALSTYNLTRGAVENRSVTFETRYRTPGLPSPSTALKPQAISRVTRDLRVIDSFALLYQQFLKAFKR